MSLSKRSFCVGLFFTIEKLTSCVYAVNVFVQKMRPKSNNNNNNNIKKKQTKKKQKQK